MERVILASVKGLVVFVLCQWISGFWSVSWDQGVLAKNGIGQIFRPLSWDKSFWPVMRSVASASYIQSVVLAIMRSVVWPVMEPVVFGCHEISGFWLLSWDQWLLTCLEVSGFGLFHWGQKVLNLSSFSIVFWLVMKKCCLASII